MFGKNESRKFSQIFSHIFESDAFPASSWMAELMFHLLLPSLRNSVSEHSIWELDLTYMAYSVMEVNWIAQNMDSTSHSFA